MPAKDRLNWETAKSICDTDIAQIEKVHKRFISSIGLEAFKRVIRDQIRNLGRWHGVMPHTTLHCEDIVAGDLNNLFFSAGDWPENVRKFWKLHRHKGPKSIKNGFVFDAFELIAIGGRLRFMDFGFFYELLLGVVLPGMFVQEKFAEWVGRGSPSTVTEAIAILDSIQNKMMSMESLGDEAMNALLAGRVEPGTSEIVFDGQLSIDHAIEIWREGELVEAR